MAQKKDTVNINISDYLLDTGALSLAANGFWITLILTMNKQGVYQITGTHLQFARICRCTEDEAINAIQEISETGIADVTLLSHDCHTIVTVSCRRMQREQNKQLMATERKRISRKKQNVTLLSHNKENKEKEKVSPTPPLKEKENKEISHTQTRESAHAHTREENYPKSADDILKIAASPLCGISISRELAEEYYLLRSAADWIDGARRKVSVGSIPANLKRWYLNKVQANSPRVVVRETGPF